MKRIGVLTSGGDSPGMNAAIRAVVRSGIYQGLDVYGIYRGFKGLIEGSIQPLTLRSVGNIIHRGGTILFSARCEEFETEEGQHKAIAQLKKLGIHGLVVIGGDGSFRGAERLSQKGVATIGIPGTIDNDIAGTEYTIGFDTAVNTVIEALDKIRDSASSHDRIFVVEVMGRDTGKIALWAGLAGGAESIIVPEMPIQVEEVWARLERSRASGKNHSIILVTEGTNSAAEVVDELKQRNLDIRMTVLGHIQRGGVPTALDRVLASKMGAKAVECLRQGASGEMIAIQKNELIHLPFAKAREQAKPSVEPMLELAKMLSI